MTTVLSLKLVVDTLVTPVAMAKVLPISMSSTSAVHKRPFCRLILLVLFSALYLVDLTSADSKVPIVTNHNNQVRMKIGDRLRLECPIHSTPSGRLVATREPPQVNHGPFDDLGSGVLYHWQVRDRLDYSLDLDPRFQFSQNRRVLEVTVPLEVSDSGIYSCIGVTGFGKREVKFQVHVRDPDANLLCAPASPMHPDLESPCFVDPSMKSQPSITVEQPAGSTVRLSCEADGSPLLQYRWLAGSNVVDDRPTSNPESQGPFLTIAHVGHEHAGHYTCQVSNNAGSLNYTYKLVVTNPPTASPKIITTSHNYTFSADSSGTLIARIQCACENPMIQWFKRVEPGEEMTYEKGGFTKIALPSARESEAKEIYVMIGSSGGSSADVNYVVTGLSQPVILPSDEESNGQQLGLTQPAYPKMESGEHGFVTRLHLQKPFTKKKHQGKYVLMTTNLANVKKMEYIVMFVDIIEDTTFLRGRRILIYFMVPFCLLFICIGALAYFLVFRRRHHSRRPFSSGNDRCILRTADIGPSGYQVIPNGKKAGSSNCTSSRHTFSSQNVLNNTTTSLGATNSSGSKNNNIKTNCMNLVSQSGFCPSQMCNTNEPNGGLLLSTSSPDTGFNCVQTMNQHGASSTLSHSVQNSGQTDATSLTIPPPVTIGNCGGLIPGRVVAGAGGTSSVQHYPTVTGNHVYTPYSHPNYLPENTPGSTPYFSGSQAQLAHNIATTTTNTGHPNDPSYPVAVGDDHPAWPHQPRSQQHQAALITNFMMTNTPSNVTEVSFDPYSAVGQSPISSSTLTNHYTAPFPEYSAAHHLGANGLPPIDAGGIAQQQQQQQQRHHQQQQTQHQQKLPLHHYIRT